MKKKIMNWIGFLFVILFFAIIIRVLLATHFGI